MVIGKIYNWEGKIALEEGDLEELISKKEISGEIAESNTEISKLYVLIKNSLSNISFKWNVADPDNYYIILNQKATQELKEKGYIDGDKISICLQRNKNYREVQTFFDFVKSKKENCIV